MDLLIEIVPAILATVAVLFSAYVQHEAEKEKQSWHDRVWKMIKDNEKPWEEWAKDIKNVISKKADKPDS